MGFIFYLQQKYLTPPTTTTLTPEQETQHRIMKRVMPLIFPLFLYSAPSGLTLYILTSSTIGILESRYIRAHVDSLDLTTPSKKSKQPSVWQKAMAEAQRRQQEKAGGGGDSSSRRDRSRGKKRGR
jgi:YidC/Oxa1 family membrane protein insertase